MSEDTYNDTKTVLKSLKKSSSMEDLDDVLFSLKLIDFCIAHGKKPKDFIKIGEDHGKN